MGSPTRNAIAAWSLRNDQIVLRCLSGAKPKDVAEEFGLTRQQVSNIINDPRAEEIIRAARERIREKLLDGIENQLDVAAQASLKVVQRTLNADISPMHKAKSNQDRVALSVLKGRGFLREEGQGDAQGFKISEDQFSRLVNAMKASDQVRDIDPFAGEKPSEDAEEIIVEAEVLDEHVG